MTGHLFFLPGVGGAPDFWRPLGDQLPSHWWKTYFGWPGLGNQPTDPAVNCYDDLIGIVEAQLPNYPVDLMAHSMGGVIAMILALRHPARIRKLVLAVTSGGMDMTRFGVEDWRPGYCREFPLAGEWVITEKPDISGRFSEIRQPTLLVWGDSDPISPVAVGQHLADRLPNAKLYIIKGGRHDLIRTHASEVASLISVGR